MKFNVNMDVESMEGKTVLVFLKPQPPQANYRIHAWQVITGSAGSTESFDYEADISTDVTSAGEKAGNVIVSERLPVRPGQLLEATSPALLSPKLQNGSSSLAAEKLTASQAGVINNTTPAIPFDCNWYVNERPVVTMPAVDAGMTCSFQYEPNFFFMVAAPPMIGQTYIVQNFSDMTKYVAPITATSVDVRVFKDQGRWAFDFTAIA